MNFTTDNTDLLHRFESDLIDSYDEELELEIDARHFSGEGSARHDAAGKQARQAYFRELFRLQGEPQAGPAARYGISAQIVK